MLAVSVSFSAAAEACRLCAIDGSAGRYMSVHSGANIESAPSSASSRQRVIAHARPIAAGGAVRPRRSVHAPIDRPVHDRPTTLYAATWAHARASTRRGARRRRSPCRVPRRVHPRRRRRRLPRRQLARAPAARRATALADVVARRLGRAADPRLDGGLDGRPARPRRPHRRARRRRSGPDRGRRLDDRVLLQGGVRRARRAPGPREIVTDRGNFPTDRYVLESLAAQRGLRLRWLEPADPLHGPSADEVARLCGERTALVTFTHVDYRTAAILDMAAITRVAHDARRDDALGPLPQRRRRPRRARRARAPTSPSAAPTSTSAAAPARPPSSTCATSSSGRCASRSGAGSAAATRSAWSRATCPPTASARSSRAPRRSSRCTRSAPASRSSSAPASTRIRAKGIALTELAIALADDASPTAASRSPRRATLRGAAPTSPSRTPTRGSSATPRAPRRARRLRAPDVIRFGLSPLTTRHAEVWDGVEALRALLA